MPGKAPHAETPLLLLPPPAAPPEERLRLAEERFRLLVEGVKDYAIFLIDPAGKVVSWNAGAERLFGYTEAEIVGQSYARFFPPEDVEVGKPEEELRRAVADGRVEVEQWQVRKDGFHFWCSRVTTALHDAEGRLQGFAKVMRDLTERKRLDDELRRQAEELRRQADELRRQADELRRQADELRGQADLLREENRRKDDFLATLAHELRNPLAPILHALHILRQDQTASPLLQQARNTAELQVRNMVHLIDDLLDASRITTGKIQLHKERIDLRVIVERAVETARPLIEAGRHNLSVSLPAEPLWLEADPTRLEQIVVNLLNNAAKYTEPGGSIWLTARRDEGGAVVRVRDTGVGIAPDVLPLVFNLFTQADASIDRRQGGLGIGLTLVRRLAELHGGTATASSPGLGKGSEFAVRLPVMAQTFPGNLVPIPEPPRRTGRPWRVLLVEDNVNAAEMLSALLGMSGHEVRVAHSGPAALELVSTCQPEVILLDINLPGMNGFEVAKRLRAQPGLEKVLIVAVTGYGQEKDRKRCLEAGFDYHLVKPVDPARLEALLNSASAVPQG